MSETEIIVKMDKHLKLKGGTYVRDLIRCENCKWFVPINNSDHGYCGDIGGRPAYPDGFCDEGEEA